MVAVLGVAGGAYAVLGSHDTTPDHYVPADAIGVVNVNLDPSTSQEVAALRFFGAFPSLDSRTGADNLIDGVLRSALDGTSVGKDFERDVRPWLGSRVAVAADPQGSDVRPLIVAEVTDQDRARAGLARLAKDADDVGYTFRDNYVIISDSTGAAGRAATDAATSSLADDARYQKGIDTLDSDRVVDGWVDLGRAGTAVGRVTDVPPGLPAKGQVAFEVRFGANHAELYATVTGASSMPAGTIGSDVAKLPKDTSVAIGLTGLDKTVGQALDALQSSGLGSPLDKLSDQTGLNLPDDITGLLGDRSVLAASGDVSGVGLVTSADPGAAKESADKLLSALGDPNGVTVRQSGDHTVLASSPDYADELAAGGDLGKQDAFRTAVPDAAHASALVYVDVPQVLALDSENIPADAQHLRSFGLTVTSHGTTAAIRMRLVVG